MESNRQYRFLITGGGGYVGFHIALKLVELGHQVVLYDLNYPHQNWAEYQLQETSQQQSIQTSYGSMQFIQGNSSSHVSNEMIDIHLILSFVK